MIFKISQHSLWYDQDPSTAQIGDVLTATVDLQGGNLTHFSWDVDSVIVAGGAGSPVVHSNRSNV